MRSKTNFFFLISDSLSSFFAVVIEVDDVIVNLKYDKEHEFKCPKKDGLDFAQWFRKIDGGAEKEITMEENTNKTEKNIKDIKRTKAEIYESLYDGE